MFVLLMLQYAGYFLLTIPINWWHPRRGPAVYGLSRAGHSWTKAAPGQPRDFRSRHVAGPGRHLG
jgi:hypothetical protein